MKGLAHGLVRTASLAVLATAFLALVAGPSRASHATTYQVGDVFVATSQGGTVQWRHPDGTSHATLATLPSAVTTGMAFDKSGNLYVTGFDGNQVSKLNNMGVLAGPFGSGYNANPESILFDDSGNAFVGQADGTRDILKFSSAGSPLASYNAATSARGSDWIDLAADQCTMFYTSEGTEVKRFDVCANTQRPDFAPPGTLHGASYALRLLLPAQGGGLLVADTQDIHRLDGGGNVVKTYDALGQNCWFALNLDPDSTSFWSADFCTSNVYKFDMNSGAVLLSFNTGTPTNTVFGLAVFGELLVSQRFLELEPATDQNPVGSTHTVTATLTDGLGTPVPGEPILFGVSGVHSASGSDVTDANGEAEFSYAGSNLGSDTITACHDANASAVCDTGEAADTATKTWVVGPPASLELEPASDTNVVDSQHCVTATIKDAFGNPTPGVTVRFQVAGSVNTSGAAVTDASGEAAFCYTGPALPGTDVITAYADTDGDAVQDANEPRDTATKRWVLAASTAGCKVTYGGRINTSNGDKATFGGNAKVPAEGPKGLEQYRDHGPATPMNVHSITVQAVTCSADGTQSTIFGQATVDGLGTFDFRIDLKDLGEPGTADTYRIRLSNGYDSGERVLDGGNVQIHFR
jgi:Bacterial Ig-like domain (group 1)